jgi:hypothetical protein
VRPGSKLYGKNWTIGAAMARAQLSPKRLLMRYSSTRRLRHAEDVLTRLTTLVWPPQRHGWNCRRTIHRRTCNADGSEQRDLTPNSSPSTASSPRLRSGKFTDDYMERTKGTTDLKSTSRHSPPHGSRIAHQDRPDRRGRKAHWTQVEACNATRSSTRMVPTRCTR